MVRAYLAGASQRSLAQQYGRSRGWVERILKEHGVALRDRSQAMVRVRLTPEERAYRDALPWTELYLRHFKQGVSLRQLGREIGVSHEYLRGHLEARAAAQAGIIERGTIA